jgi:light-regulated signal transduction histidine kinase (bacteriophytochrome)
MRLTGHAISVPLEVTGCLRGNPPPKGWAALEGASFGAIYRSELAWSELAVTAGVGIAPEDQEAVFEEFRQVGTADKEVEGTGLGLALSRKFIELHGGRIWVKSQVGQGSTFTFTLPVREG